MGLFDKLKEAIEAQEALKAGDKKKAMEEAKKRLRERAKKTPKGFKRVPKEIEEMLDE